MDILGAIGFLMSGSGLEDILKQIFADDAVVHLLSGKAVSRAFRGHLIVDTCLNSLLFSLLKSENKIDESRLEYISNLFDISNSSLNDTNLKEITSDSYLLEMQKTFQDELKEKLAVTSKTCKLWIEYQNVVYLARLIEADRSRSWKMHLSAIQECLPIMAAAGHYNYLKSTQWYLQNMLNLETHNKHVFEMFQNGCHVIRRSNKFWGGLGVVIEQTLMRTLKTAGGLTRGGGMSEAQRGRWTLALPLVTEYSLGMDDATGITYSTSEQHIDTSSARITCDHEDTG